MDKAKTKIIAMFGDIAGNYDKANNIISFGLHRIWKKKLVKSALKAAK